MPRRPLAPALLATALSACSVVGVRAGTEEPKYQTLAHLGPVEIRRYAPRIAAETTLTGTENEARNLGFRRIAAYIFGANHTGAKIAMTAPVGQAAKSQTIAMTAPVAQSQTGPNAYTIRFFMPAAETLATLPTPNNPDIHLVPIPAQTYAVLRFTGLPTAHAIARHTQKLLATLKSSQYHPTGTPTAWFYDPPWTLPFLRRNEVAVEVSQ